MINLTQKFPLFQERVSKVTETCMGVLFWSLLNNFGTSWRSLFLVSFESIELIPHIGSVAGRVFHYFYVCQELGLHLLPAHPVGVKHGTAACENVVSDGLFTRCAKKKTRGWGPEGEARREDGGKHCRLTTGDQWKGAHFEDQIKQNKTSKILELGWQILGYLLDNFGPCPPMYQGVKTSGLSILLPLKIVDTKCKSDCRCDPREALVVQTKTGMHEGHEPLADGTYSGPTLVISTSN